VPCFQTLSLSVKALTLPAIETAEGQKQLSIGHGMPSRSSIWAGFGHVSARTVRLGPL